MKGSPLKNHSRFKKTSSLQLLLLPKRDSNQCEHSFFVRGHKDLKSSGSAMAIGSQMFYVNWLIQTIVLLYNNKCDFLHELKFVTSCLEDAL